MMATTAKRPVPASTAYLGIVQYLRSSGIWSSRLNQHVDSNPTDPRRCPESNSSAPLVAPNRKEFVRLWVRISAFDGPLSYQKSVRRYRLISIDYITALSCHASGLTGCLNQYS